MGLNPRTAEVAVEGWCPVEDVVRRGFAQAPAEAEPLLVWCGNGHATRQKVQDRVPMGWHFREMSGVDAVVVSTDNGLTEDTTTEDGA